MEEKNNIATHLLLTLINASAGVYKQYQFSFWGQLILGFLYSFGYFDSKIAGFILGFFMPVLWITLTYRYVLYKRKAKVKLPFPKWMQKNPGNTLVVMVDILFLSFIWAVILTETYEATWLKVFFTMIFPILTLSMLRNLVIYPFPKEDDDESSPQNNQTFSENRTNENNQSE